MDKIDITQKLSLFNDHWKPRVVAELNAQHVKLVKFQGPFVWHRHQSEDKMALVWNGRFRMEFRNRRVWLEEEGQALLFEPATTLNTGDSPGERTVRDLEWI